MALPHERFLDLLNIYGSTQERITRLLNQATAANIEFHSALINKDLGEMYKWWQILFGYIERTRIPDDEIATYHRERNHIEFSASRNKKNNERMRLWRARQKQLRADDTDLTLIEKFRFLDPEVIEKEIEIENNDPTQEQKDAIDVEKLADNLRGQLLSLNRDGFSPQQIRHIAKLPDEIHSEVMQYMWDRGIIYNEKGQFVVRPR